MWCSCLCLLFVYFKESNDEEGRELDALDKITVSKVDKFFVECDSLYATIQYNTIQ